MASPPPNVKMIQIGKHQIKPWYFSPYPIEFCKLECIYLCDFCFTPCKSEFSLARHQQKCQLHEPPGKKIYSKDNIAFFEVDGQEYPTYSKNLCLLAKLFLNDKTLYYDINPFLFYIMTELRDNAYHLLGYFSKEKNSPQDYNLACILVLPTYQRLGYGRVLIDLSFELSRIEGKKGSPEKPLSPLGALAYQNYWKNAIIKVILNKMSKDDPERFGELNDATEEDFQCNITISAQDVCEETSILMGDITDTLRSSGIYTRQNNKDIMCLTREMVDAFQKAQGRQTIVIDPNLITFEARTWALADVKQEVSD